MEIDEEEEEEEEEGKDLHMIRKRTAYNRT